MRGVGRFSIATTSEVPQNERRGATTFDKSTCSSCLSLPLTRATESLKLLPLNHRNFDKKPGLKCHPFDKKMHQFDKKTAHFDKKCISLIKKQHILIKKQPVLRKCPLFFKKSMPC
jgi:hypothetical protein